MAIDFPSSPVTNQPYTVANRTWIWNGVAWQLRNLAEGYTGSQGVIGFTGSQGDVGFTGSQGVIGFTGSQGVGFTGSQGNIGPQYGTRVVTVVDGTSITMNADTTDTAIHDNTQVAGTLTVNAPTGTPVDGQKLMLRINSVNAQTLSWNAAFSAGTDLLFPGTTSGGSKTDYYGFMYYSAGAKWHLISNINGF